MAGPATIPSPRTAFHGSEFAAIVEVDLVYAPRCDKHSVYADVETSSWFHDAVTIASEFGIIKGYADSEFHGNEQITREQGIAMIARALNVIGCKKR